jgi:peptide/nickel transport system substrate-binding protein
MSKAAKLGLRILGVGVISSLGLASLTACANVGASAAITVGTTDQVVSLDPAGEYDNGSFALVNQVYPFLMNSVQGKAEVSPDIAVSAGFTSPKDYTVVLKSGLKFANGHDLTASDVKFSFDREVKINDANGPASLLWNLDSVSVTNDTTVVFHLKNGNDQTFAATLSSPAGPIVDEQSFPADKLLDDNKIVAAHPFAGQYDITSYKKNELVGFKRFDGYKGNLGVAKNSVVNLKYYTDASNLKLDVQKGNIDVASRSLSATDIQSLEGDSNVTVHKGPGGEIRYIVFNFNTQPFGAKTAQADPKKALAVRQAVANLVDRQAIADQVYKGTYSPLYSYVPTGIPGATTVLKSLYGTNGAPDVAKAKAIFSAAGITAPVTLNLQWAPDHYGPSSGDEYALIKSQLESSGLFKVNIQSTDWVTYSKERTADAYPAYQLGWFPDYSDADNYLTPFFLNGGFLANHYDNKTVDSLITAQGVEGDSAKRLADIEQIQATVAKDLSTLPLLQGAQVAVAGKSVKGVILDPSFKFRFASLTK